MLPSRITRVKAPPIKCQGIKTKLVPLIGAAVRWAGEGKWVEPFLGSGVVAFNLAPDRALLADTNQHLIRFFQGVQSGSITPTHTREFLEREGNILQERGEDHYYAIRERFNAEAYPLDFLFLNRSCFNGLMRFNLKGGFNVPFCRKPDRFRPAYVTKIVNQVKWLQRRMRGRDWTFKVADWRDTLKEVAPEDFVYLDPPYVGRHTDYYNQWSDEDASSLALSVTELPSGFAYSMWKENRFRANPHLDEYFADFPVVTKAHFYHVGSSEDLRHAMEEALVISHGNVVHRDDREELLATPQTELAL